MPSVSEPTALMTPLVVKQAATRRAPTLAQTDAGGGSATLKGAGVGLVIGALAGVAVGAMIESGNKGGAPDVRERYKEFGYAVFVPLGAVVGAVIGGIVGARRG